VKPTIFTFKIAGAVLGRSVLLGCFCSVIGTLAVGLLFSGIFGSIMVLGAGLEMCLPFGITYGLLNGFVLVLLLWHNSVYRIEHLPSLGIRIGIAASFTTILTSAVIYHLAQYSQFLITPFIIFGSPAMLLSALWAGSKIRAWYENMEPGTR
jgi:hypothetical protein